MWWSFCKERFNKGEIPSTDGRSTPSATSGQLFTLIRLSEELYTFQDDPDWENPENDLDVYEEKYYSTHAILRRIVSRLKLDAADNSIATVNALHASERIGVHIQLTRIKLPTLFENYDNWEAFIASGFEHWITKSVKIKRQSRFSHYSFWHIGISQ